MRTPTASGTRIWISTATISTLKTQTKRKPSSKKSDRMPQVQGRTTNRLHPLMPLVRLGLSGIPSWRGMHTSRRRHLQHNGGHVPRIRKERDFQTPEKEYLRSLQVEVVQSQGTFVLRSSISPTCRGMQTASQFDRCFVGYPARKMMNRGKLWRKCQNKTVQTMKRNQHSRKMLQTPRETSIMKSMEVTTRHNQPSLTRKRWRENKQIRRHELARTFGLTRRPPTSWARSRCMRCCLEAARRAKPRRSRMAPRMQRRCCHSR